MMSGSLCRVPFGQGGIDVYAPDGWVVDVAVSAETPTPGQANDHPPRVSDDSFERAVRAAERAVIVFTDATRESPDELLARQALRDLMAAGMKPDQIAFLCAVGMHRPSTSDEKRRKLGRDIVTRYPVYDHDPDDVVQVGGIDGVPVQVNRRLAEPGTLVLALGVVEPHQYAGYSGGSKTVAMGCGGAETIAATHGPRFLRQPGTRLGRVEGNPFQGFVRQAGRLVGVVRVYNALLDSAYRVLAVKSGPSDAVHDALVAQARRLYEVPVNAPYDIVLAGVGAPKDQNLYQASRAATYIGLSGLPVIRPGGVIILPAPIPEGAGSGQGERNFIQALRASGQMDAMLAEMDHHGCRPGEQRAYMIGQLLANHRVIVVGAQHPEVVREAHLTPTNTLDDAFALAQMWLGEGGQPIRLLVVPHALQTIPVPA